MNNSVVLPVLFRFTRLRLKPNKHQGSLFFRSPQAVRILINPIKKLVNPLSKGIFLSIPLAVLIKPHLTATATTMDDTMKQVDELYMQNKLREAYDLCLPHKDADNVVVQWKFARLCYRMGKMDSSNSKQHANDAMEHMDRAVAIDPNCFDAQKWRGIILSWYCDFEGYKKKIERSYEIRQNFDAACKLKPEDPTARHLLGRWSYSVADVPWYMKSAAKYILAELPNASYEDALKTFLEAEEIEEGFFSQNWLYIGKCYYNLKNKVEAKKWLQKAASVTGDNQDDNEAKKEAAELLKKI